ncbi:MAG: glycosyltransferase family 2 protein [Chthoniobacteraceae bacterium]
MNAPARITVCLPAYNAGNYIAAAIESVLAQTCSDWLLIIADNHSADDTAAVARRYRDARITVFEHPKNLGMVANWQFVLEKVDTPFFCLLAADDYFYPEHLETKLRLLEDFPDAAFVHSAVDIVDADGNLLRVYREPFGAFETTPARFAEFFQRNFVNIAGAVIRMDLVRRFGLGFDSRFSLLCDWYFFMTLLILARGFAFDATATSVYRYHIQSVARQSETTPLWIREQTELQLAVLKEHPAACAAILDPEKTARLITQDLWRPALRECLRENRESAARFWQLFRQFHSPVELISLVPSFAWKKTHHAIFGS